MEKRTLKPEVAMYVRRIGNMRSMKKHGRAVQLCDRVIEHQPDPKFMNIILNFKADSLYRIGRRTGQEFLVEEARHIYANILENDPYDQIAIQGLERINFSY